MRVLHIVTSLDYRKNNLSSYVAALSTSMGENNDVHVATFDGSVICDIGNIKLHHFDIRASLLHITSHCEVSRLLLDIHPDIIHIHGGWDNRLAYVARKAKKIGIPCVLSSHGAFAPEIMQTFLFSHRIPSMILYQYNEISNVTYIIVNSESEKEQLLRFYDADKFAILPEPIANTVAQIEWHVRKIILIYRKILDSRCHFASMPKSIKEMVIGLMREGCRSGNDNPVISNELREKIGSISQREWRYLYIVGHFNCLLDTFALAFQRMNLPMPKPPTGIQPAQKTRYKVSKSALNGMSLVHASQLNKSIIDSIADVKVREIAIMLLNAKVLVDKKVINLYDLTRLYVTMRYEDYDEDQLAKSLKLLHIYTFTANIEVLLYNLCGLTEGFMPIAEYNGFKSKRMIRRINKML